MADEPLAIAGIRLARSLPRILAAPLIVVLAAACAIVAGLLLDTTAAMFLWPLAAALLVVAVGLALMPLTLRLDVEVGGLRVRWLLGARRYQLVPGAVTRSSMSGGAVRAGLHLPGWAYGRAVLHGDEAITLLRLAPAATVILVPTDRGRLAIAAASEPELLEGLSAAARVQQRLDEVSGRVRAALPPEVVQPPPEAATTDAPEESGPRILTGIERARLEAELAAARQAALEAAEAERQAIAEARAAGEAEAAPAALPAPAVVEDDWAEAPLTRRNAARRRARGTWTRPEWATDSRLRVLAAMAWALVPVIASLVVFLVMGGPDALATDDVPARLRSLALLACGPLAALGVLAARAFWPRLAGLVTVTSLLALVLLARAVTG